MLNNYFTDQKRDDDLGEMIDVDEIINSTRTDIERLEESILLLQANLTEQMGNTKGVQKIMLTVFFS